MAEEIKLVARAALVPAPTARDLAAVYFRNRRLFWSVFLFLFSAIFLYGLLFPSYRAEMKILVRRGRIDPMATSTPSQSPEMAHDEITEEELNSEVELLESQDILRSVVENAGLAKGPSLWALLGQNHDERSAHAVKRLIQKLDVEPAKKATVIDVAYTSSDPKAAAKILSCLASAYLMKHKEVRRPSGEFDFFEQQMTLARKNLEQSEGQLMQFTRDEGVVSAAAERDSALQKLSQADSDSEQTKIAIAEVAQRIRSLELKLPSLPERVTTKTSNSDNPQLLEKMKSKLLELKLQRTDLLTKFSSSYRLVREVDEQIAEAKAATDAEEQLPLREQTVEQDSNHEWVKAELLKSQVELNALLARSSATSVEVASYRRSAKELGDHTIRQQDLLQNLKMAEDEYMLYANKREEARIGDALDRGGILNATLAQSPVEPALPVHSAIVIGLFAFALAGAASTGSAFAADYMNPAFRTPDEVHGYLGMPVLASLPHRSV